MKTNYKSKIVAVFTATVMSVVLAFGMVGCAPSHDDQARETQAGYQTEYAQMEANFVDLNDEELGKELVLDEIAKLQAWRDSLPIPELTLDNGSTELYDALVIPCDDRVTADSEWIQAYYQKLFDAAQVDLANLDEETVANARARLEELKAMINDDQLMSKLTPEEQENLKAQQENLSNAITTQENTFNNWEEAYNAAQAAVQSATNYVGSVINSSSTSGNGSSSGSGSGSGFSNLDSWEFGDLVDGSGTWDGDNYWYSDSEKSRIYDRMAQEKGYANDAEYQKALMEEQMRNLELYGDAQGKPGTY